MTAFIKFIEEVYEPSSTGQMGKMFCRTQFIAADSIESVGFEWVDKPKCRVVTKSGNVMVGTFVQKTGDNSHFNGLYAVDKFWAEFEQLKEGL